jgi:predicted amidohydrolase
LRKRSRGTLLALADLVKNIKTAAVALKQRLIAKINKIIITTTVVTESYDYFESNNFQLNGLKVTVLICVSL